MVRPNGESVENASIVNVDCQSWMKSQPSGSVQCIITSPPYNLGIEYKTYEDELPRDRYLDWLGDVFQDVHRILDDHGHFFLNVGHSSKDPWVDIDVSNVARKYFVLQNRITWVKSLTIGEDTYGHFKPINSPRFITLTNEPIFHFTKTGLEPVDRSAVGVPYQDKSNLDKRSRARGRIVKKMGFKNYHDFKGRATEPDRVFLEDELEKRVSQIGDVQDRRCRGNTWFIPYDTIKDRELDRGSHPATFPVALPEMCIRFAGCKEGSTVYDPFAGSGTTLIAAQALGMLGIGTEIDKQYAAYASERLMTTPRWAAVDRARRSPG